MNEVFRGDTSSILYVRPGALEVGEVIDSNWTCYVGVVNYLNTVEVAHREVTEIVTVPVRDCDTNIISDEQCFMCYLTPTETLLLTTDVTSTNHISVVEVINSTVTPPFNKEYHTDLFVKEQALIII